MTMDVDGVGDMVSVSGVKDVGSVDIGSVVPVVMTKMVYGGGVDGGGGDVLVMVMIVVVIVKVIVMW